MMEKVAVLVEFSSPDCRPLSEDAFDEWLERNVDSIPEISAEDYLNKQIVIGVPESCPSFYIHRDEVVALFEFCVNKLWNIFSEPKRTIRIVSGDGELNQWRTFKVYPNENFIYIALDFDHQKFMEEITSKIEKK